MQLQALAMGLNCRVKRSLLCKQTEKHKSAVVVGLAISSWCWAALMAVVCACPSRVYG